MRMRMPFLARPSREQLTFSPWALVGDAGPEDEAGEPDHIGEGHHEVFALRRLTNLTLTTQMTVV